MKGHIEPTAKRQSIQREIALFLVFVSLLMIIFLLVGSLDVVPS